MSYQSIETGLKERFFTVVGRSDGNPITAGTVNYYLKAKSGDNAGKWWQDSDQTWQDTEVANTMTHEADGHWEIELTSSPFIDEERYLEYVKEASNRHVPDSRHLVGQDRLNQPDNDSIALILESVQDLSCDTETTIAALTNALKNISVHPERVVLGPCQRSVTPLYPARYL